jgi:hypothetical protein
MSADRRLVAYARAYGLTLPQARDRLLALGLDQWEAQTRGGLARSAKLCPEARSAIARRAAVARWAQNDQTSRAPSD